MKKIAEKPTSCTFCHGRIEEGEKMWVEGEKAKEGPSTTCATCFWGEKPSKENNEQIDALRQEVAESVNMAARLQEEVNELKRLLGAFQEEVLDLQIRVTDQETAAVKVQTLADSNRRVVTALFEMVKRLTREVTSVKSKEEALTIIEELISIRKENGI